MKVEKEEILIDGGKSTVMTTRQDEKSLKYS